MKLPPTIDVIYKNKCTYRMFDTGNGYVNYYPLDASRLQFMRDHMTDEFLFFPSWKVSNLLHSNYGYLYQFKSNGHTTILLGYEPLKLGMTSFDIITSVRRIKYKFINKTTILVTKVFQPLYPPCELHYTLDPDSVGTFVEEYVKDVINTFNEYYSDKDEI